MNEEHARRFKLGFNGRILIQRTDTWMTVTIANKVAGAHPISNARTSSYDASFRAIQLSNTD